MKALSGTFYELKQTPSNDVNSDVSCCLNRMRNNLNCICSKLHNAEDEKYFIEEMQEFYDLFQRYTKENDKKIDWQHVKTLTEGQILPYSAVNAMEITQNASMGLTSSKENGILSKLAVVKLNGGLGTSMGCVGPKSAIEVREGFSFLDLSVQQLESMNCANGENVPLILMNSFNTNEETSQIIQKYSGKNVDIITFNQSKYPRIDKDTQMPVAASPYADKNYWYPPGHGDFFKSIAKSGLLDKLIKEGKEYLFVSNIDNLGAIVDPKILAYMIQSKLDFLMEVTDKTRADIKGGTLINYKGHLRLLEVSQVPNEHLQDFNSVKLFKIFNTNNIWIRTRALKEMANTSNLSLDIIVNPKVIEGEGRKVIQLETAIGAAIKHFTNAQAINVPRSRFLPVKNCSDLFLVQSDLYSMNDGFLKINPLRPFPTIPLIKLGDGFRKVASFKKRFPSAPKIVELEHLTVVGDVHFGSNVTLKGTVIIVAVDGCRIDIPSGSVLEDKVISGNLTITDH